MSENSDIVYGRLLESAHISGYGFERMTRELESLLAGDNWRTVGPGFKDINEFLRSIDLSAFNIQNKEKLHKRIKELQPESSNRAIGKATGADERTVRRHTKEGAADAAPSPDSDTTHQAKENTGAADAAPVDQQPSNALQQSAQDIAKQADQATKRKNKEAAREQQRERNAEAVATGSTLETPTGRYATIVFDPPWSWDDEGDATQLGRARPNYHTMSFDEVKRQPIDDYAADDAHIYLWITNRSLPKGPVLLEAWGFRYITTLTWCKPHFGMGNYFRGSTEHVLFGVKGSLSLLRSDVGTWFTGERGAEHSAKPDAFYELVEQCSPGPWVDILGRHERPGWAIVQAIEEAA